VQSEDFPPNVLVGSAGCPCVTNPALHSSEVACEYNGTDTGVINAEGDCFPSNYGIASCVPWDKNMPTICKSQGIVGGEPDHCDKPWCYVDPANCDRPNRAGSIFTNQTYSYETCGYKDTFADERSTNKERAFATSQLEGITLRVTFPGDWLWSLTTEENGDRGGVYPSVMARIFREYSVNWVVKPISNSSKAFSPNSSYTACVHDVAIGETDMCIGEFWTNNERISIMEQEGAFSTTVTQDDFYLVATREERTETLRQAVGNFFALCQSPVWVCTVLIVLYVSLAMYAIFRRL
jgi:hypothetical protein